MSKNKSEYRSIFKATAILGSVQLFNIIIGVVRNKIVSMLLGPTGMGIIGLLQSSSSTVSGFTNCGISASSVKNIAMAHEEKNISLLGKVIYTIKRLIYCTGTLASLILLIFCKQFSVWSFGNEDFTLSFACLSISLLFTQLTSIYQTIIKGCRYIKFYAKANVLGNFISLLVSVPLYFVWGKEAIVPVLIIVSVSTFLFAYYYQRKTGIKEEKASKEEFKEISVDILKMGIPLAVSEIFPIMASYLIRLHVADGGGVIDVGLYSAGFAILNGYVGMIFTAMSSDFIPRLSAIVNNNGACQKTINSQIHLAILVLFPILLLLIALAKLVVWILYSAEFYPMIGMIYWGALGMLLKTFNWCYGCVLIPKRDSRPYFIFSVLSAVIYFGASIGLYTLFGVTGLGLAFLVSHTTDFLIGYIYISRKYEIKLEPTILLQLLMMSGVIGSFIFVQSSFDMNIWLYIIEGLVIIAAACYSLIQLNKLMDLKSFVVNKFKK